MKLADEILSQTVHRPWPIPSRPWVMEQGWYDLLFAHWEVPLQSVRGLVPRPLEVDAYHGSAWISVASFLLRMRPRGAAVLGRIWSFPELNLRTYASWKGRPGIYFFSLDAASLPAVMGARVAYRLPYFHARMSLARAAERIAYRSVRMRGGAAFAADYRPASAVFHASPGTLTHWLTERYCLYVVDGNRVRTADIHHPLWPLQNVDVEIGENTLPQTLGLSLPARPDLAQFSARQEVLVWLPRAA